MILQVLSGPAREQRAARTALATAPTRHRVTVARGPGAAGYDVPGRNPVGDVAEIARLSALAVTSGSRLLHCHGASGAWHAWKAAGALGMRWGISLHGPDLLVRAPQDPRLKGALVFARMVVVPSQFLADAALGRAVPHERVVVVPPGVPLGEEPPPRDNPVPVVAFTGAFTEQSGVLQVADVLRDLPVRARFAGSGPLLADLQATGADVTVTDDPAVQRQVLDTADLAVTAGRTTEDGESEAWGRTAVEAQAAGLPVVATRNGGLLQWVCRDGAVLVPSHGDIGRSLHLALTDLLARPEDWPAMGRAGREHVRRTLDVVDRTAELAQHWQSLRTHGVLDGALVRPPDQY